MRSTSIYARTAALACLAANLCSPAAGQSGVGTGRIGSALSVKGTVESNVQGRAYPLQRGGNVYWQQFVNTRTQSSSVLGMVNESKFVVGPSTSVRLDKPEWDPRTQSYHQSLHMLRKQGAPEAASGRLIGAPQDRTRYDLHTPEGKMTAKANR